MSETNVKLKRDLTESSSMRSASQRVINKSNGQRRAILLADTCVCILYVCVCECNRESESVKSVFVGECVPPRAQLWASIEGVCVCVSCRGQLRRNPMERGGKTGPW